MNEKLDRALHETLPIGKNEKILQIVRHHWFAYVSIYAVTAILCLVILAALVGIVMEQDALGMNADLVGGLVIAGLLLIFLIAFFAFIPVWIKKQEYLVLTEESLIQHSKPSLFASKISQVNLQNVNDVSVRQDMIGSFLGFGSITVETPGEQNNYLFTVAPDPHIVAKVIVEAHENYSAALESGQIQTTLGSRPPQPGTAWRPAPAAQQQAQEGLAEHVDYKNPEQAYAEQPSRVVEPTQKSTTNSTSGQSGPTIPKPPTR